MSLTILFGYLIKLITILKLYYNIALFSILIYRNLTSIVGFDEKKQKIIYIYTKGEKNMRDEELIFLVNKVLKEVKSIKLNMNYTFITK